jgi:hypothetical protein
MRPEDVSKEQYTNWLFEQARMDLGRRPAEIGMTKPRMGKGMKGMGEPGEMEFLMPLPGGNLPAIMIPPPRRALDDLLEILGDGPFFPPREWSKNIQRWVQKYAGNTQLGNRILDLFTSKTGQRQIPSWYLIIETILKFQRGMLSPSDMLARGRFLPVSTLFDELRGSQGEWINRLRGIFSEDNSFEDILELFGLQGSKLYGGSSFGLMDWELDIVNSMVAAIQEINPYITFDVTRRRLREIVRSGGLNRFFGGDQELLTKLRTVIEEIKLGFANGEDFELTALMAKMAELQAIFAQYEQHVSTQLKTYLESLDLPSEEIDRIVANVMPEFFVNDRRPTETINGQLTLILKFYLRHYKKVREF